jgi:Domain of unknown function (DUF202)
MTDEVFMIRGYSDHAANERTFLAWLRTGIAVIAFGFGQGEGPSVVALAVILDAKTGAYKNHFKIVPRDWHDGDVSNPPALIRTAGGKRLWFTASKRSWNSC